MNEVFSAPDQVDSTSVYNPYSQRAWWNCIQVETSFTQKLNLYERALTYIPGSYKLWHHYLSEVKDYVLDTPSGSNFRTANALYERALRYLYLMPRIWLDYLEFLIHQGQVTRTRQIFDLSLQQLPITQHALIWDLYIEWVKVHPVPQISKRILERYLELNPNYLETYIEFLVQKEFISEAVDRILEVLQEKTHLAKTLVEVISQNPDRVSEPEQVLEKCRPYLSEKAFWWTAFAELYIRKGKFEETRGTFERALAEVNSPEDFGVVFAAYTEFEEDLLNTFAEENLDELAEQQVKRLEELLARRELALSDVVLRSDPNSVEDWLSRAQLFQNAAVDVLRTYAQAITIVDPFKASKKYPKLWINFARVYEEKQDLKNCRTVFHKAVQSRFRTPDQASQVWEAWIEFEIRNKSYEDAYLLASFICNSHLMGSSSQRLWHLYLDLAENLDSLENIKKAYNDMIARKLVSPQTLMNYCDYLQQKGFWEEAFRVYEKGVNNFQWPHVYEIWVCYLKWFVERYGERKLERSRELFEEVLRTSPKDKIKVFYLMYAKLEENYGLLNHAIEIYDKAVRDLGDPQLFYMYMQKASEYFGICKMRTLFETAFESLFNSPEFLQVGMNFAKIESKLGEIERARSIFNYVSELADPRKAEKFWKAWEEFELYNGNEDTFREMMRIKRTQNTRYSALGPNIPELQTIN